MTHLPDELIQEILSPALQIAEKDFADTSPISPFSTVQESTSAYLVVCKSWLRVATPLLYNFVVLRSTAQAKALANSLRENKSLGKLIKKLRVEGGFGSSMHQIITRARNVTHLWLSLCYVTGDSVAGLCRALPIMKLTHLILSKPEDPNTNNAPTRNLVDMLRACFAEWDTLEVLEYPFGDYYTNISSPLAAGIIKSKTLKMIILPHPQTDEWAIRVLLKIPTIEKIRVVFRATGDAEVDALAIEKSKDFENYACVLPDAMSLRIGEITYFEYPTNGTNVQDASHVQTDLPSLVPLKRNKFFVPLQSTPTYIAEIIWDRILYFALLIDEEKVRRLIYHEGKRTRINDAEQLTKVNTLLVSKLFYKLGRTHSYRCLIIKRTAQLQHIANLLDKEPSLALHIHSIYTYITYDGGQTSTQIHSVLSKTSNLQRLISPVIDAGPEEQDKERQRDAVLTYHAFTSLANAAGVNLLELSGQRFPPGNPRPAAPIFLFKALRHLEWNTPLKLTYDEHEVPRDALSLLETLTYSAYTPALLNILGLMELPSLRHVYFARAKPMAGTDDFLLRHGPKILTLETCSPVGVLGKCPALRSLRISGAPSTKNFESHSNLRKLTFTRCVSLGQIKTGYRHLGEIDFGIYPSLQEVVVHTIEWPINEHEIKKGYKAVWPKWAERLMQWEVKLTDKEGNFWRARLK